MGSAVGNAACSSASRMRISRSLASTSRFSVSIRCSASSRRERSAPVSEPSSSRKARSATAPSGAAPGLSSGGVVSGEAAAGDAGTAGSDAPRRVPRYSSHASFWRSTSTTAAASSSGPIASRPGMRRVAPARNALTFPISKASGFAARRASIMRCTLTESSGRRRCASDQSVSSARTGPYNPVAGATRGRSSTRHATPRTNLRITIDSSRLRSGTRAMLPEGAPGRREDQSWARRNPTMSRRASGAFGKRPAERTQRGELLHDPPRTTPGPPPAPQRFSDPW